MDHPFWESFAENSPLHWDQIAAQYVGVTNPVATTEDLQLVGPPGAKTTKPLDFTAFTDSTDALIPWRTCSSTFYTTTGTGQLTSIRSRSTSPIGGSNPAVGLRNYYDFIRYTQATQGHLNSQGSATSAGNTRRPRAADSVSRPLARSGRRRPGSAGLRPCRSARSR